MLKQYKELSMFVHRINEKAGIRPSKTYQSFVAAVGGHRKLSFIKKDMKNYITREFGMFLNEMMPKNLGIDHSIKNAFWADERSRAVYEYFGNIISFDTTYNTNRYNLVFGSFVGVNHQGQSTLFGCALMKNEDIQSFKYLFECGLCSIGGKAPKEILTD
ncbi:hypothetical protein Ahy_B06g084522 isoform A [Arachis hypogaea]|uniref:MULE transposase domain-containing protein n=1 Tax=Arachis hypogaea TaxID=3818 RepID=A0A444YS56_ARAHY|nr:hypothetical protein Ahy_B06g084522 isoform A [Arachis hypogaea]